MTASDFPRVRSAPRLDRIPDRDAGGAVESSAERVARASQSKRYAVLVIGMHRSGTSAFTRVLSLCGARLPQHLMAASERNPLGYFESQRIYDLHEQLLAEAGSAWDDLAPFPTAWLDSPAAPGWIERMAEAFRSEFGDSPVVTLKDPRIARLIPFWLRVLERVGYEPAFVIPVRNPLDVAASLARAEDIHPTKAMLLWLEHLLAAERDTRGRRRSFASYDALLGDWRRVVARIAADLDLAFPRSSLRAAAEIDAFLATELRHHASSSAEVLERANVPAWVKLAFDWATRAAAGEGGAPEVLDALEAAVRPAEIAFGPVVAALEVARDEATAKAERLDARATRLAADLERVNAERDAALLDAASARSALVEREQQTAQMADWLKLLLGWAMRTVHGGEGADDHIAAVTQAVERADASVVPQVAALGMRLSQQAAELARVAEESDLHAAEARNLGREAASLRAELERREPELAELPGLRRMLEDKQAELARHAQEAERANQQVRGLWQQLAARDAEMARLRHDVSELDVLRHQLEAMEPLRREAAGLREQIAALEQQHREALAERERILGDLTDLRRDSAARDATLAKIQTELRDAGAAVADRDLYIEALRQRAEAVERSRLWRAVRPLSRLAQDVGAIFRR